MKSRKQVVFLVVLVGTVLTFPYYLHHTTFPWLTVNHGGEGDHPMAELHERAAERQVRAAVGSKRKRTGLPWRSTRRALGYVRFGAGVGPCPCSNGHLVHCRCYSEHLCFSAVG